jgi:hypothetical protein
MKKITNSLKFLLLAIAAFTFTACSDEDGGSTGGNSGDVSFWNNDYNVGVITVTVSGRTAQITDNISPSGCGESGCANFNLSAGTYTFSASATTGETWSGNCTIESGGCLRFNLY